MFVLTSGFAKTRRPKLFLKNIGLEDLEFLVKAERKIMKDV